MHASMGSLMIKVEDSEQGVHTTPTMPDIRLNIYPCDREGIVPIGMGCAVGLDEECDDSRDKEVRNSLSELQVRIPQAKAELASCELSHQIDTSNHILPSREDLHSHDGSSRIATESPSTADAGHDRVGDQRSLGSVSPVSQPPSAPSTPLDSKPED